MVLAVLVVVPPQAIVVRQVQVFAPTALLALTPQPQAIVVRQVQVFAPKARQTAPLRVLVAEARCSVVPL